MPRRDETAELPLDAVGEFPEDWECSTLGKACSLVTDGTHDSPKESAVGFPLVTGKCITGGRVNLREAYLISEADHRAVIARSRAEFGDILFANIGNSIGELARVETDAEFSIKNVALFKPSERVESRFLKYYLLSPSVQTFIRNTTFGSAQPFIGLGTLRAFPIPLPNIDEQKFIGKVLGALDDKIELNRRMNETLEALAQSLFKSWFVDATQSALPKGWRAGTLGELAAISGGKQLPTEECKPSGKFTVFGANGIMGYADKATHEEFVIAFGRVGAYCGSIHWSYGGAWINNNASSVVPHRWPEFVLQAMLNVDFAAMRTGSAQPFIPNSSLSAAKTIRPTDDILDSYCSIVRPLRLKQNLLNEESRTLAALRDALLPKLLSGELRVPSQGFGTAGVPDLNSNNIINSTSTSINSNMSMMMTTMMTISATTAAAANVI